MLRLHEDILLEMKAVAPDPHLRNTAATPKQSKHPRWYSVESAEALSLEAPIRKSRPTNDFSWLGIHRNQSPTTTPGEAADIARVFERMVRTFHRSQISNKF